MKEGTIIADRVQMDLLDCLPDTGDILYHATCCSCGTQLSAGYTEHSAAESLREAIELGRQHLEEDSPACEAVVCGVMVHRCKLTPEA